MAKVWTYTPNEYTTGMTFTVTFTDGGSPAVFTYNLVGGMWTLDNGSNNGGLSTGGQDAVSITDNGRIKKIQCLCFNSSTSNEAQPINVKRIVFLTENDIAMYLNPNPNGAQYLGRIYGINDEMWTYFGSPDPISFTSMTDQIEMPELLANYGNFYGYGILNCTKDPLLADFSNQQVGGVSVNGRARCMWVHLRASRQNMNGDAGNPRLVKRDSTGTSYEGYGLEYLDNSTTMQNFAYDGFVYYAIPLYYNNGETSVLGSVPDRQRYGALRPFEDIQIELNPSLAQ